MFFFIYIYPVIKKNSYEGKVHAFKIEDGEHSSEDGITYCPIYYFKVLNITYECTTSGCESLRPDHSKDLVYYDPSNPNDCLIEYKTNRPFYIYLVFILPVFFIIGGFIEMIKNIKCGYYIEKNNYDNNENNENNEINSSSRVTTSPVPGSNDFINDSYNNSHSGNNY